MTANITESLSSDLGGTSECHFPLSETVKKKKKNPDNKIKSLPLLAGAFRVLYGCETKSNADVTSAVLGCLSESLESH